MTIKFGEIGNTLGTRFLGQKIRHQIEHSLNSGVSVAFDFKGVEVISHSFADECFGKLLLKRELNSLKKTSTFKNTNTFIEKTILLTFRERQAQLSC